MAETVRIEGLKELDRALRAFPLKVQKKVMRRSVAAAAKVIFTEIKAAAPRDSGALRRSIARRFRSQRRDKKTLKQSIYVRTGQGRTKGQLRRGDDPYYWYMQEFGYRTVGRSPRKGRKIRGRKIPGKRFMRGSFDKKAPEAARVFRETFAIELRGFNGR